ncbi:hypothetical protein MKD33_00740, partial [Chromobacterium piscinae]
MVGALV